MNLEKGIDQLSQLFMSANACMERNDYRAAINEYNKIIELVKVLRKPFDNGEVPINVVTEVLPKIIQAEKAARDAMNVAQLGIDAQKKSAENQDAINISQPQNNNANSESISIDDFTNSDIKQFTQHVQAASDYMEKGDYNSAISEYNMALDRIRIVQFLIMKQADNYPANQVLKTMEKITDAEINIHKGLFVAYFKVGNNEKAAEEQKAIDTLTHSNNSDVEQYTQHMLKANDYIEKGDYNSAIAEYHKALDRIRIVQSLITKQPNNLPSDFNITNAEFDIHTGLFVAYSKIGNKEKAAEEQQKAMNNLSSPTNTESNPVPPQNQYNAQSGGCFSTIFIMCVILIGAAVLVI